MITAEEIALTRECIAFALSEGASAARITLTKSTEDLIATLDGEVDRVTRCADRSMSIALFADGRFGSFSINKLERSSLQDFIRKGIQTVRMLAPDAFRKLPSPERYCRSAEGGREMEIYDEAYHDVTAGDRRQAALAAAVFDPSCTGGMPLDESLTGGVPGLRLISEEGEYSDSVYDVFLCDSQGLECRHTETSFDYGVEVTLEDGSGNKYSDYWWTASPRRRDFSPADCGPTAIRRAAAQVGAAPVRSTRCNMVVAAEAASRLVSPLLNALNGYSIQQGNSFLVGSKGQKLFTDGLGIIDEPFRKGEAGSKLFDNEGVATENAPVISGGTVERYFINTYMSGKLGMEPTVEDAVRPRLLPWPSPGLDRSALMEMCGSGILVTDFNGGNCNMATGDFSYGISGQLFKNGKPVRPVNEMLVTGNFLQLWKNFLAAGEDYRLCSTKLIPSLAFRKVDFSG